MTQEPDAVPAQESLAAVHAALVAKGNFQPVAASETEQLSWMDYDLAAFAENRVGEVLDPHALDDATRKRLSAAVLDEQLRPPAEWKFEACYWIVRSGERLGTIALSTFSLGCFASAYSIYVRPAHRGRGVMAGVLRTMFEELRAKGLGLRVETEWTWQQAVRLYVRNGFWLRMWKRDLSFIRPPNAPPPIIDVRESDASLSVELGSARVVLARARRTADLLTHHDEEPDLPDSVRDLAWDARSKLALAVALTGWPLIHSREQWRRSRSSDAVQPEALAERIATWEAWSIQRGWRVATPRIPGLEYPTWSEIERRRSRSED